MTPQMASASRASARDTLRVLPSADTETVLRGRRLCGGTHRPPGVSMTVPSPTAHVEEMLSAAGINEYNVALRQFDTERIYVVSVPEDRLNAATQLARELESRLAG